MPEPGRAALKHLRRVIKEAAPGATEYMTYGMPGFRDHGALVSYAAFKAHLSFFPMSATLIDTLGDEIAAYRTSKGTIQFTPDHPLPDDLVRKIVAARLEQNAGRKSSRPSRSRP